MKVIIADSAKESLTSIYNYNLQYSLETAIEIDRKINLYINNLKESQFLGRYVPEILDSNYRELIYKRNKNTYRIVYYISKDVIYILYIVNSKQNFNRFLKLHKYFNNSSSKNIDIQKFL